MNQIVAITGAGSGLGSALAKKYAQMGCTVCLLGRSEDKLRQKAERISEDALNRTTEHPKSAATRNPTQNAWVFPVDVSDKAAVEQTVSAIEEEVGPIDILINSAGVIGLGLAVTLKEDDVHRMIDVNLKGTIFVTQAVLPSMKHRNQGIIANVISTAGQEGKVNESVYCASKFGVRGFTEALLAEVKDTPIQVFAAYMGGMKTEFWDGIFPKEQTAYLMEPDDIAELIMASLTPRANLTVTEMTIKNKIRSQNE